ncbi:cell envelope integrity protein TolA [Clostridium sp. YIM B02515]|uniref:Cell envelope integrity protein TolA n=1 Tax=Clostridium rhizosphaerae TaxID=2803861 RepID=A0ABS1TDK6_9CLOT|nr:cell envelope integrity protein TolA [Clostridium rhizosphaerae]MBL4937457.1 cell envelope integrity protein TolA [Clostridium rhizosphaerae]
MKFGFTKNKSLGLLIIGILIAIIFIPTSVYAYKNYNYNKYYKLAIETLANEKFDDAVNYFRQSIKYSDKHNSDINSNIELVNILKKSKISYDEATKLLDDGKYLEAIDEFKKVPQKDTKYFEESKLKADFAKSEYIKANLVNAKKEAENKNYSQAIVFLDNIVKIEPLNQEAGNLVEQYNIEIQKKAEEDAKKKAEEDAKKKAGEDAKKKVEEDAKKKAQEDAKKKTQEPSKPSSGSTGSSVNYIVSASYDMFNVKDSNGNLVDAFGLRFLSYSTQPNGIYYSFVGNDVSYKVTFHIIGRDVSVSGKSSEDMKLIPANRTEVPRDAKIKIDMVAVYKGKTYSTTFEEVINKLD